MRHRARRARQGGVRVPRSRPVQDRDLGAGGSRARAIGRAERREPPGRRARDVLRRHANSGRRRAVDGDRDERRARGAAKRRRRGRRVRRVARGRLESAETDISDDGGGNIERARRETEPVAESERAGGGGGERLETRLVHRRRLRGERAARRRTALGPGRAVRRRHELHR